jgi:hypothetical protein
VCVCVQDPALHITYVMINALAYVMKSVTKVRP